MFRFSKPETPRAALFVFLRNETRAKSGFVSYVSISLCFDFDPIGWYPRLQGGYPSEIEWLEAGK